MSNEKIDKVVKSEFLLATNRITTPILLSLLAFLAFEIWSDLKAVAKDVIEVKIQQATISQSMKDQDRRLGSLERMQYGR